MNNIDLLFSNNQVKKYRNFLFSRGRKKYFRFKNPANCLDGGVIRDILVFCNSIIRMKIKLPIILDIGKIFIADKLSYVVLECIVYRMIEEGYSIRVNFIPETMNIDTKGINMSPIIFLNECHLSFAEKTKRRETEFKEEFKSQNKGTIKFRRLISPRANDYLSKFTSDLIFFLKNQYKFRDNRNMEYEKIEYHEVMVLKLANSIGELVGNAIEHGGGECLLDIDISHNFSHLENQEKKFGAVNVAIVNFSKVNFGDKVRDKILNSDLSEIPRYQQIEMAYNLHKSKFNNIYTEENFWAIASLQDKISGRPNQYKNGGKGSTELIKSIQEFTHEDYCYMMSGKEIINLRKEFLETDKDGFISFNKNTFLEDVPTQTILKRSRVYLPGVAYNLNFILEEV